jgi:hypothetical protein
MRIGDGDWITMEQVREVDPKYRRAYLLEQAVLDPDNPQWRELPKPKESSHLWKALLPANLPMRTHLIEVRATDDWGRTFTAERILRVQKSESTVEK